MISKDRFKGKVAIVTGSAMGIGRSIAESLFQEGCKVVISDINQEEGRRVASAIGERATFIACDISEQSQVNTLVSSVIDRFGTLDIMVNNAGVNSVSSGDRVTIDRYPDETWHRMIDIDLNGTFYCCKAAAGVMIGQGSGSIINIGSVAGVVALRLPIGFVAAKAAILKMTEAMACELSPFGIRVNSVSPGSILTEPTRRLFYSDEGSFSEMAGRLMTFIPQGRPGETTEVAGAVCFLASDSASYITGHNIVVDGGWTCGFNRDF